jgi:hypothetical protein
VAVQLQPLEELGDRLGEGDGGGGRLGHPAMLRPNCAKLQFSSVTQGASAVTQSSFTPVATARGPIRGRHHHWYPGPAQTFAPRCAGDSGCYPPRCRRVASRDYRNCAPGHTPTAQEWSPVRPS